MQKNLTPSKLAQPVVPASSKGKAPAPKVVALGKKGSGKSAANIQPVAEIGRSGLSAKAGLQFGVPRISRFMKAGRFSDRIGAGAPVYLAAALQYITSEIIELSSNEAQNNKKQRIVPRHIMLAIRNDIELNKLLGQNADFVASGVVPNISKAILPGGKKGKGKDEDVEME